MCKVFECILKDSIIKNMEINREWDKSAPGFTRSKSLSACLDVIDEINDVLRNALCVIYVDLSNAFDMVVLQKLRGTRPWRLIVELICAYGSG